jgi:hypothetical protein
MKRWETKRSDERRKEMMGRKQERKRDNRK